MYDWLNEALQDSSQVITANRRLARVLTERYAEQQVASGLSAWRSPAIVSWQDWLQELLATAELSRTLPTRLNTHQSRVLWERCLRREVSSPLLNIAALVRQAKEAWARSGRQDSPGKGPANLCECRKQLSVHSGAGKLD
jgi:hypothetical protein